MNIDQMWALLPEEIKISSVIKRGDGSVVQVLFTEEKVTNLVLRFDDWTLETYRRPVTPEVDQWYSIRVLDTVEPVAAKYVDSGVFKVGDLTYQHDDVEIIQQLELTQ